MGIRWAASLTLAATAAAQTFATYGDRQLGELLEEALANNPRVVQSFAEYQAALHRVPQAAALPDPSFSVTQYARSVETRVGPQERSLAITQTFPGFGKRAAKGQLEAKAAAAKDELYQAARAEVARQTKAAYFDLGFVDLAIELNREDAELIAQFEDLAQRRYSQGFGLLADVVRLQAQITETRSRREQLERQRVDLEARLNALRDLPADTPVGRVRLAALPSPRLDLQELLDTGRASRPDLKAAFLQIEGREKGVHLARTEFRPDFTAGVTWGNILRRPELAPGMPVPGSGKDVYAVTFGMTLPIFRGKYEAGVREAVERFSSAKAAYRSAAGEMEAAIRSVAFRIETIARQIQLFKGTLLPQAEQAFRSTRDAYAAGLLGVSGLLDVQRLLVDARLGLARLRADHLQAMTDLERAIGSPVPLEEKP